MPRPEPSGSSTVIQSHGQFLGMSLCCYGMRCVSQQEVVVGLPGRTLHPTWYRWELQGTVQGMVGIIAGELYDQAKVKKPVLIRLARPPHHQLQKTAWTLKSFQIPVTLAPNLTSSHSYFLSQIQRGQSHGSRKLKILFLHWRFECVLRIPCMVKTQMEKGLDR